MKKNLTELTRTEKRVLNFICTKSAKTKDALKYFQFSLPTYKAHVHNIMSKLGVEGRAELVRLYHLGELPVEAKENG